MSPWAARRGAGSSVAPPVVAPKWGNSAANAYMLMYRRVDPTVNKRHLSRDEVTSFVVVSSRAAVGVDERVFRVGDKMFLFLVVVMLISSHLFIFVFPLVAGTGARTAPGLRAGS